MSVCRSDGERARINCVLYIHCYMTSDTILTRGFWGEKERERGRKGEREGELKSSAGKNAG